MATGRALDPDGELRALLRSALLRISSLEVRMGEIDLARLDGVEYQAQLDGYGAELRALRDTLSGLADP